MLKVSTGLFDLDKLKNTVVLFASKGVKLGKNATEFDKKHEKLISAALKSSRFQGDHGNIFAIPAPSIKGVEHVVVLGVGEGEKLSINQWRKLGVPTAKKVNELSSKNAFVVMEEFKGDQVAGEKAAEAFLEGMNLGVYQFDQFLTQRKDHQLPTFEKATIFTKEADAFKPLIALVEAQTEGANLARDLVNLPPNVSNPDYMTEMANKLKKDGVKVKILGEKEMTKLGMNCLLAVGRASEQESRLIIMKYMGDKDSKDVKCIVGKGVMFDTGGYNLKPTQGMAQMKADMAGSAAVMGAMKALAKRKAKVNVIAVCGCVMNMVGGNGFLPSDILTSYNGKTVEIGNTDAEGRLVLADAMSYIIDKEKPSEIIDVATLTGACMVALGGHYGGMFTNSDDMAEKLQASGETTGERLWRMPIDEGYAVKSQIADLNNNGCPWGGASAAAVFLKNFVGDTPWAHLDIAGVGIGEKIPGTSPVSGASGFGARLLVNYLES